MEDRPVVADGDRLVHERSLLAAGLGRLELTAVVAVPHPVVEVDAYLSVATEAVRTGAGAGAEYGIADSADSGRTRPETPKVARSPWLKVLLQKRSSFSVI